jgi:sugar O-acyltransferase (sialic acid O-acetyltransferase NeuD family)
MQVVARRGVSAAGHATMPRFTGTAADSRPTLAQRIVSHERGVWILGAGGHAKVVIRALQLSGVPIAGIYDDYQPNWGRQLLGVAIFGPLADLDRHRGARGVLAIGDCRVRQRLARRFSMDWMTVVHPTAYVDPTAEVAPGAVVLAGAIVQPCARIGAHAIINTAATVDHDSIVLEFAHLAPGVHLAGGVRVGRGTLMGIGSRAIPGVQIGDESIVGAGATVVSDLPAGVVAVGTPARVIKPSNDLRRVS